MSVGLESGGRGGGYGDLSIFFFLEVPSLKSFMLGKRVPERASVVINKERSSSE